MTCSPIVGCSTLQRSALCKHWIVEFFDIPDLNTITQTEIIEHALHEAAEAAGATVLFNKMHSFGPDCGVTGVAVRGLQYSLNPISAFIRGLNIHMQR